MVDVECEYSSQFWLLKSVAIFLHCSIANALVVWVDIST